MWIANEGWVSPTAWWTRYWLALQSAETVRKLTFKDVGKVNGLPDIGGW